MFKNLLYKVVRKCLAIYKEETDKAYHRKYELHNTFKFNGENIHIYGKGKLIGGKYSYIGSYSTFQLEESCSIIIGDGCRISHNVRMYTRSLDGDTDLSKQDSFKYKVGNIVIEDYVWVGANVFINPGITIGRNSTIGANSVVTKDVEPNSIVGGVPAKLIRFKNVMEQ